MIDKRDEIRRHDFHSLVAASLAIPAIENPAIREARQVRRGD